MGNAVEVQGLAKAYGSRPAVEDVSFSVEEGEAFGYLGPNGAGKTTTIRCLLGLIRPRKGRIRLLGSEVSRAVPVRGRQDRSHFRELGLWPQMTAFGIWAR
jgi:ABC-2 type transport system ATP-binding protein